MTLKPSTPNAEDDQNDIDLALHTLRREKLANNIFVRAMARRLWTLSSVAKHSRSALRSSPRFVLLDLKLPKSMHGGAQTDQGDARNKNIRSRHDVRRKKNGSGSQLHLGATLYPDARHLKVRTVKTIGLYWLSSISHPR